MVKTKRTLWFWLRVTVLVAVAVVTALAGADDWRVILPGAVLIPGGALLVLFGAFQWALLAMMTKLTREQGKSQGYSLNVHPFSGRCFFITGFVPFVVLAIGVGASVACVIDGYWAGLFSTGVMVAIALFWIRWNRLLAGRYCEG